MTSGGVTKRATALAGAARDYRGRPALPDRRGSAFEFMALPDWAVGSFAGVYASKAVTPFADEVVEGTASLTISKDGGVGGVRGVVATDLVGVERFVDLVQNVWKRTDDLKNAAPAFPTGREQLRMTLGNGLEAKFGAKGAVTVSGKLVGDNGRAVNVSVSAQLVVVSLGSAFDSRAQFVLYVAPRTNLAAGHCELVTLQLTVDGNGIVTGVEER